MVKTRVKRTSPLQALAWLHTWVGLVIGWLLFSVCLTGSLAVFHKEINQWMQPELQVAVSDSRTALATAERYLLKEAPDALLWSIRLPSQREPALELFWQSPEGDSVTRLLKGDSGELLNPRDSEGGEFLVEIHYSFHAGTVGIWLVGLCGFGMLLASGSGLYIHRRLFKDFFTFRPRGGARRSWLDAHNLLGVLALPFHLMIAYTGLVVTAWVFNPAAFNVLYDGDINSYFRESAQTLIQPSQRNPATGVALGSVLANAEARFGADNISSLLIFNPGRDGATIQVLRDIDDQVALAADRLTYDGESGELLQVMDEMSTVRESYTVMAGLHYAEFGGALVQWLYFLLGFAGCGMVATGLVLFTIKFREQHRRMSGSVSRVFGVIERLNVVAVASVLVASAAYFWANRLLPLGLEGRAGYEIRTFFVVWLLATVHALWRQPQQGWREQLGLAAVLCLLLPVLNALTTDMHLLHTFNRGDWRMAAVDLAFIGTGLLLAGIGCRMRGGFKTALAQ